MTLVLIIGDTHIPYRSSDIPTKFKELFKPNKIKHIFLTGNLCTKEQYDYFKSICSNVHVVRGEFDELNSMSIPDEKVVDIENYKIGMIHGHQVVPWGDKESLASIQRRLDVDILISGHTHELSVWNDDNKIFINPGTATGAYSEINPDAIPTFVIMDVGKSLNIFLYKLQDDRVVVNQVEYNIKSEEKK